ncbi:hypothetical protein SDC9_194413 [bioreactor metagenome]|uniref:Uncharacterized protein n=1 Tax=bioreactor metagenome TaxID=1076179 RepID=A0A645IET0_9ZZZZ
MGKHSEHGRFGLRNIVRMNDNASLSMPGLLQKSLRFGYGGKPVLLFPCGELENQSVRIMFGFELRQRTGQSQFAAVQQGGDKGGELDGRDQRGTLPDGNVQRFAPLPCFAPASSPGPVRHKAALFMGQVDAGDGAEPAGARVGGEFVDADFFGHLVVIHVAGLHEGL